MMGKLCRSCGAGLLDTAEFCGACGAKQNGPTAQALSQPAPPATRPTIPEQPRTSNTALKLIVGLVGLVCVGGVLALGATIYLAHKAVRKVQDLTRQAIGKDSDSTSSGLASLLPKTGQSDSDDHNGIKGDPCRFLSKEDVSHATGVTIIRADAKDGGCLYVARGDPADMTSKHMAAMVSSQAAGRGEKIPGQQQQMMQQITGAFFKEQEDTDKNLAAEAAKGEVLVVAVSFESKAARMTMRLTKAAFDHVKQGVPGTSGPDSATQTGTGDLSGLGDEAYEMGGTMLIVRKGDSMARFLFNECPCSVDAIKPLAEKVVNQL
jgi:hypothetical protein